MSTHATTKASSTGKPPETMDPSSIDGQNPSAVKGNNVSSNTVSSNIVSSNVFKSSNSWFNFLDIRPFFRRVYEKATTLKKNIKYQITLIHSLVMNYFFPKKQPWFSEIKDEAKRISNIYLGGIPLKSKGHIETFNNLGITSVLSLLEDFEYQETFFSSPIKKDQWSEATTSKPLVSFKQPVAFKQIEAQDFLPLTQDQIDEGVKFLTDEIKQNKTVYVHCKAGKGRSVTIVCSYLIKEKQMTSEEAIAFVKSKRPNITPNKHQIQAIKDYEKKIKSK